MINAVECGFSKILASKDRYRCPTPEEVEVFQQSRIVGETHLTEELLDLYEIGLKFLGKHPGYATAKEPDCEFAERLRGNILSSRGRKICLEAIDQYARVDPKWNELDREALFPCKGITYSGVVPKDQCLTDCEARLGFAACEPEAMEKMIAEVPEGGCVRRRVYENALYFCGPFEQFHRVDLIASIVLHNIFKALINCEKPRKRFVSGVGSAAVVALGSAALAGNRDPWGIFVRFAWNVGANVVADGTLSIAKYVCSCLTCCR